MSEQIWREVFVTSQDGLKLIARDYGPSASGLSPILCLAGLTRNSKDFHSLAIRLGEHRRVIVPDYRGRGLSDYAADWQTYQPDVEMADALNLLDHLGIEKVTVIGTSRGGLIAMLMGQMAKHRLNAVILNDIGPKLEDEGLIRIAASINERSANKNWSEVVDGLKKYSIGFSGLSDTEWQAFAHNLYRKKDGEIVPDYDFNLTRTFPDEEFIRAGRIPEAWEMFDRLCDLPVAVIRGENSDLLSAQTIEKMQKKHPDLVVATVPNRAHVPFLNEPEALAAIDEVLSFDQTQT